MLVTDDAGSLDEGAVQKALVAYGAEDPNEVVGANVNLPEMRRTFSILSTGTVAAAGAAAAVLDGASGGAAAGGAAALPGAACPPAGLSLALALARGLPARFPLALRS